MSRSPSRPPKTRTPKTRTIVQRDDADRTLTPQEAALAAEALAYAASDAPYTQYSEEDETGADLGPPPSVEEALAALSAQGDAERAAQAEEYHKGGRPYLGVPVPLIEDLVRLWRAQADVAGRVALAGALWHSNIHEARVAAAKLLTQARLRPDEEAWALITSWVPEFDAWSIADHVAAAGSRRLLAAPHRLDEVETWLDHPNLWARRAALVFTQPFTRTNHPDAATRAARERVLGWCLRLAPERDRFVQKAVAGWLRDLSKHDAAQAQDWLGAHGSLLTPAARKEAARFLPR